jgi:hypothetical protein
MEKFLSLYDYLGKPAGKELGLKVSNDARAIGIPSRVKQVSNPKYTGEILMYPENWLIGYFSTGQSNFNLNTNDDNRTLPF